MCKNLRSQGHNLYSNTENDIWVPACSAVGCFDSVWRYREETQLKMNFGMNIVYDSPKNIT